MLFTFLAIISGICAIVAVTTAKILRAAVALIGVLTASAGLFLLLGAEFLAGVQILVYVGGVVVLLVFAIMLTRSDELQETVSWTRRAAAAAAAIAFFVTSVLLLAGSELAQLKAPIGAPASVADLGRSFVSSGPQGYILPFELVSFCLLAVLIGAIVVAHSKGGHDGH